MINLYNKQWVLVVKFDILDIRVEIIEEINKIAKLKISIPIFVYDKLIPNGFWFIVEGVKYVVKSFNVDYNLNEKTYNCEAAEVLLMDNIQVFSSNFPSSYDISTPWSLVSIYTPINIINLFNDKLNKFNVEILNNGYNDDCNIVEEGLYSLRKVFSFLEKHNIDWFFTQLNNKSYLNIFRDFPLNSFNHGKIDTLIDIDSINWSIDENVSRYRMLPNWSISSDSDNKIDTWNVIRDYFNLNLLAGETINNGAYIFNGDNVDDDIHELRWKIPNRLVLFNKYYGDLLVYNDLFDKIVNFYSTDYNLGVYINAFENASTLDTSIAAVKYDRDESGDKPAIHIYETRPQDVYFELQEKMIRDFKEAVSCEINNIPKNNIYFKLGDKLTFKDGLLDYIFNLRVCKIERNLGLNASENKISLELISKNTIT